MLLSLFLLALAARDVAVIDVGGGARVDEVRAVVRRLDPNVTVIAARDAQDLYEAYGKACGADDGACWQRAALAGSVQAIVLVGADRLVFVGDGAVRAESDPAVAVAVERGLFRDRFGVVVVKGAPAGAVVLVDGRPGAADGLVRGGPHVVRIDAKGFVGKDVAVTVGGGGSVDVDGSLVADAVAPAAPPTTPPPTEARMWLWPAASAGVFVVGAGAGLVCEGVRGNILADAAADRGGDKASFDALGGVELASFVIAGLAAASAVAGASVVFPEGP